MYDIYTHINKIQETANSCLQGRTPNGHRKSIAGTSLVVQWLRLQASTAGGTGSIPGQGTKITHAAGCDQKKKERVAEMFRCVLLKYFKYCTM